MVIDSLVNYIDEAQQRNYERWPILGQYVYPNYNWQGNDFDDEVSFFENWFFNRLNWIDNNLQGTLLSPSAQLSGSFPELMITLEDDYFNRPILKKKYLSLNNFPMGVEIDTVIFEDASHAHLILSGNLNNPVDVTVTLKSKILNSFDDLNTDVFTVGIKNRDEINPGIRLFATHNLIHLECEKPWLLGEKLEIFNSSGQHINSLDITKRKLNIISVKLKPGIFLCRLKYKNAWYTCRLVVYQ
jgi:hypothetical protein